MCGIVGHYSSSLKFADITRALSCFRHRGPDASTIRDFNKVRLGYNRLSINDINSGFQPLFNSDRSVVVFYNGEIYNHTELRKKLKKSNGHQIPLVDGAVIPYLYEEYGETFTEKIEGMYAIALYDLEKDKLILCRDLVGEKPLYYWQESGELMFCSSLIGLKSLMNEEPLLDFQSLWDYPSYLWVPEPQTPFISINSIMPGQTLVFQNSCMTKSFYRELSNKFFLPTDDETLEKKLHKLMSDSVSSMVPKEVPFGTFLSSGLDSSIVSTLIAKNEKKSNFDTFCVEFPNIHDPYHGLANESDLALEYAKALGTAHHTIKADAKSLLEMLDDFVKYADSPFAVSSGIGVMLVAKKAKMLGLKVLLSGDGADELYGGYSWYASLEELCQIHATKGQNSATRLDEIGITLQNRNYPLKHLLQVIGSYNPSEIAFALHYYMLESEKQNIFSKHISSNIDSAYRHMKLNTNGALEPMDFVNHDRKFYLTQEMMRKIDRFTMAYSIEGRVPFVSFESLRFASGLPFEKLVKGSTLKLALRKALSDELPRDLIRRAKHGFNVPIDYWLRNEWKFLVESTFSKGSMLEQFNIIDEKALQFALRMVSDTSKLNGHSIFSFIVLEKWLQYVFGGENN